MSTNLPAERPACPRHGPMTLRKPGTDQQEWCGVWYACDRCQTAQLIPSAELCRSLVEPEPTQLALSAS